jgi:hypothetical protein
MSQLASLTREGVKALSQLCVNSVEGLPAHSVQGINKVKNRGVVETIASPYASSYHMRCVVEGCGVEGIESSLSSNNRFCVKLAHPLGVTFCYGIRAIELLSLLNTTAGKATAHHQPLIKVEVLPHRINISVTVMTLARTLIGREKRDVHGVVQDVWTLVCRILGGLPVHSRCNKARRLFLSVSNVFATFQFLAIQFPEESGVLLDLGMMFAADMISEGQSRTRLAMVFLNDLESLLNEGRVGPFVKLLASMSVELRAAVHRARRVWSSDKSDPLSLAREAITRFKGEPRPCNDIVRLAIDVLQGDITSYWKSRTLEQRRKILTSSKFNYTSGSLLMSRQDGGGNGELHLVVGMYRLSQGKESKLRDVFVGWSMPNNKEELAELIRLDAEKRDEILKACEWFMHMFIEKGWPILFTTIFPDREPKGRSFALFPVAAQLLMSLSAAIMIAYFKSKHHEYFTGLHVGTIPNMIKHLGGWAKIIAAGFNLDSADALSATDTMGFGEGRQLTQASTIAAGCGQETINFVTSPMPVAAAKGRTPGPLARLNAPSDVLRKTGGKIKVITPYPTQPAPIELSSERTLRAGVVLPTPVGKEMPRILQALNRNRIVLLQSGTGSGKTVTIAAAFRCTLQQLTLAQISEGKTSMDFMSKKHGCSPAIEYSMNAKDQPRGESSYLATPTFMKALHVKDTERLVVLEMRIGK